MKIFSVVLITLALNANVFAADPHPKDRAIEFYKSLIATKNNPEVNDVIARYAQIGLKEKSNEYSTIFLGGDPKVWTYMVSMDYWIMGVYRSLVTVIAVPKDLKQKPVLKKVFSAQEVNAFVSSEEDIGDESAPKAKTGSKGKKH